MELSKQVITLEQAKRLKELGVNGSSICLYMEQDGHVSRVLYKENTNSLLPMDESIRINNEYYLYNKNTNQMKLHKTKYRVVGDIYAGYEIQFKKWWMPFWLQNGINTFSTKKEAIEVAERLSYVKYIN